MRQTDMINWFGQQDPAVQAAIVAGVASIVVALITGIFKLLEVWRSNRKKKNESQGSTINITQSTSGSKNTIIGVQNNKGD